MIIKGKSYTSKNLHMLPVELNGYNVSNKTSEDSVGFFGELSPFSNFHTSYFEIDGKHYHSVEQYLQPEKALLFKDYETSDKIMRSSQSIECKNLSRDIGNFSKETWAARAEEICLKGVSEKFKQNSALMKILQQTGDKKIVECSYDCLWGCGMPLSNDKCLDDGYWRGENLLGNILMQVRRSTSDIVSTHTTVHDHPTPLIGPIQENITDSMQESVMDT